MAIVWMDNFSLYGGSGGRMAEGVYASTVPLANDPDPNAPAGSKVANCAYNSELRKVLQNAQSTMGQACRIWMPDFGNNHTPFLFKAASLAVNCRITVDQNGRIAAVGPGGQIGITTNPVIVPKAWQHVEAKVVVSPTAGSVEVRVEGITVLNVTGVNTGTDPIQSVVLNSSGDFANKYSKDWVVWDGTGTINNNFVGSVQVVTLLPNADVSTGWTISGGATASEVIAETTGDDDTDYIQAGTGPIPAATIVELQELPVNVTSVRALMPVIRARKIDGGDGNLQVGITSGGQTTNGSDRPITTAYTFWHDVIERDPATNSAWIPGAVNAARLRINRTL